MPEWWEWNAAVAIATFLAVLAALFGDALRSWMFRPSLKLALASALGRTYKVNIVGKEQEDGSRSSRLAEARYYHLRVANGKRLRWPMVRNVRVLLLRIEQPDASGQGSETLWAGEMPLRWVHQEVNPLARSVGPEALCEFLSVVETKWISLCTLVDVVGFPLAGRRDQLQDWVITVQARGLEADSPEKRFSLSWNKQWHPGENEMAKNLVLRELPPQ